MRSGWLTIMLAVTACQYDHPADLLPDAGNDPTSDTPIPANVTLSIVSGDAQIGTSGAALAEPMIVYVENELHEAVENFTVEFTVQSGDGHVSDESMRTDILGRARTTLTLGNANAENVVQAHGTGTASVVSFHATGHSGELARLTAVSGGGQTSTVATSLPMPLVVAAVDAHDNPIEGVDVTFAVTAGSATIQTLVATTNASGTAETTMTLGTVAGAIAVRASATGITPVVFAETATGGAAKSLVRISGNDQVALPGAALANPFVVGARDQYGNPVAGTTVTWVVTAGGGTVMNPTTTTSGATGTAQTKLSLATSFDAAIVEARSTGLATIAFNARARAFASPWSLSTTSSNIAIGDLNADNKPDIAVVTNNTTTDVVVFRNTTAAGAATPSFAVGVAFSVGETAASKVEITEMNGDTLPELVVKTASNVVVLPNITTPGAALIRFGARLDTPSRGLLLVGDLNGDGLADWVGLDPTGSGNRFAALNTSTPSSLSFVSQAIWIGQGSGGLADFDGDSRLDLFSIDYYNSVNAWRNTTTSFDPTFSSSVRCGYVYGESINDAAIGDIDHDGSLDVVSSTNYHFAIARNTSTPGMLSFSETTQSASYVTKLAISDLDKNGFGDLVGITGSSYPFVALNTTTAATVSTPSFGPMLTTQNVTAVQVLAADIDGDNFLDVVTVSPSTSTISIYLSR